jgi:hypothetical protein
MYPIYHQSNKNHTELHETAEDLEVVFITISALNGPVYHPGTSFVPEFHTGTYQCIGYYIHLSFFFLTVCPCFAFKKHTYTSKFPFRALVTLGRVLGPR